MTINELVEKYRNNRDLYILPNYNETQLRADFLDPLFELLGWDIKNSQAKSTNEREVLLEEPLKEAARLSTKKPDYTFRLFSLRKFFLEAKKPAVRINSDTESAKQIRRYGFTAKLKISVLSNFEYLAIYDCSEKVEVGDNIHKCRIKLYHYTEYEDCFEELLQYLGRDSVYSGHYDEVWSHIEDKIKQFGVDKLFLGQINNWRLKLGSAFYSIIPDITESLLNDLAQSYLNSIIFLRVCEDRNIEEYQTLLNYANDQDFHALIRKFQAADKKYNSGLFSQPYKKEMIENSQSVFWEIIKHLYYPESTYSFSVFTSDILGNIYEIFIAKKLTIADGRIILQDKPENLDRDVVATPTNIVQDILRLSLKKYLENKTADEILKTKVADIACGSGAFLLEAFQTMCDLAIDFYIQNDTSVLKPTAVNSYKLPYDLKRHLLEHCIFGIDKDYNAVQACRFGLLSKLLEEEDVNSLVGFVPILPDLENNIVYGNSLVAAENCSEDLSSLINPYDFGDKKFDVLIGNPPYMSTEDMKNITPDELPIYKEMYKSAYKQFDKYYLFIERGCQLLSDGGYLGYIVPSKFTKVGAATKLRDMLAKEQLVEQIISFGANQVFGGKTNYTCLLLISKIKKDTLQYSEVRDLKRWVVRDFSGDEFDSAPLSGLNSDAWTLVPGSLKDCFDLILKQSIPLGKLVGQTNIYNGIQTSANDIFIQTIDREDDTYFYFSKDGLEWKIEREFTRPYFRTSAGSDNLFTYRPFKPNAIVIYPYEKKDNQIVLIPLNRIKTHFPFAYKFLKKYKTVLSASSRDIRPTPLSKNEWYRYGRHQSLEKCDVPEKIIVGVLSQGDKYAIDYYQTVISSGGTAGYCMITLPTDSEYSIYYIQTLLNSRYLEWFSSLYGEVFRGGYIARGTKVLQSIPIRTINFSNIPDKILHDKIVDTQKKMIKKQEEMDDNFGNQRDLIKLKRQFDNLLLKQNLNLKELYNLGDLDQNIPLISEIYGTA